MSEEVSIKYLDALMSVFVETSQLPSMLRNKITVLRSSMRKETQSADVSVPIKIQKFDNNELDEEE